VYSHKDVETLLLRLAAEKIHRAQDLEIYAFDRDMIPSLTARLTRRMSFDLVVTERQFYISLGEETIGGGLVRHSIPTA
jgi:uncharacterized protein YaeQ